MKQLWAPWRMAYIDQDPEETGCVFCNKVEGVEIRAALILARTAHAIVMLNKYPYVNGHLLVAPYRHAPNPLECTPEERAQTMELLAIGQRTQIHAAVNDLRFVLSSPLNGARQRQLQVGLDEVQNTTRRPAVRHC